MTVTVLRENCISTSMMSMLRVLSSSIPLCSAAASSSTSTPRTASVVPVSQITSTGSSAITSLGNRSSICCAVCRGTPLLTTVIGGARRGAGGRGSSDSNDLDRATSPQPLVQMRQRLVDPHQLVRYSALCASEGGGRTGDCGDRQGTCQM